MLFPRRTLLHGKSATRSNPEQLEWRSQSVRRAGLALAALGSSLAGRPADNECLLSTQGGHSSKSVSKVRATKGHITRVTSSAAPSTHLRTRGRKQGHIRRSEKVRVLCRNMRPIMLFFDLWRVSRTRHRQCHVIRVFPGLETDESQSGGEYERGL